MFNFTKIIKLKKSKAHKKKLNVFYEGKEHERHGPRVVQILGIINFGKYVKFNLKIVFNFVINFMM